MSSPKILDLDYQHEVIFLLHATSTTNPYSFIVTLSWRHLYSWNKTRLTYPRSLLTCETLSSIHLRSLLPMALSPNLIVPPTRMLHLPCPGNNNTYCFNKHNNEIVWSEAIGLANDMLHYWIDKVSVKSTADDLCTLSLHVLSRAGFGKSFKFVGYDDRKFSSSPSNTHNDSK